MKRNTEKPPILIIFLLMVSLPVSLSYAKEASSVSLAETFNLDMTGESQVAFKSLEQMDELVRLGMPGLASRLVNHEQKKWPTYSSNWYAYERKAIELLAALDDWQQVIDRIESLLNEAIPGQKITRQNAQWFSTQQIIARLRLGQAEKALSQLRDLLWSAPPSSSNSEASVIIALWRRLVIRAYLAMNVDADVQKALLRYQYDYNSNHQNLNLDWQLLQARSLLRTHRADEVLTLLADSESHIAKALRLLAAVRVRPNNAGLYAQEAQSYLNNSKFNKGEVWAYNYVIYQAYLAKNKIREASVVLKKLLVLGDAYLVWGEEFSVSGDDLWKLYETIGHQIGNRSKLLVGDDLAWYNKANALQRKNVVDALGLYVVLAFNASNLNKQQMAHKKIVTLLGKSKNGSELISQLYLHGTKISSLKILPLEIRFSLLDYSLSKSNLKSAVRLMKNIVRPPEGEDVFSWAMRKARVMILEGDYKNGEVVLADSLKMAKAMTEIQLDRFLQVIFDLQAVRRHQQVLVLLDSLKPEWLNADVHRELFFWKAESYSALEKYDRAAWSYLKSAQLADLSKAELWAQSARFKAAGVLVKTGLYDDAQVIYIRLLEITASDSRKASIKQELQQIRLLRNSEKNKNTNPNEKI